MQTRLQLQGKCRNRLKYSSSLVVIHRIVMAYDLELWFIRSIIFIGIAPSLGPKLVMIRKMVRVTMTFYKR
jgi:hypothetical protein